MKKSQHKKFVKANKWQKRKSRSESKKLKPLKLKTLIANQDCFLSPKLERSLLNRGKD